MAKGKRTKKNKKQTKLVIEQIDKGIPAPKYALPGDGGLDCYSTEDCTLTPGEVRNIPLGIKLELPKGYVALVLPKSGLGSRIGLDALPGLIDTEYRGQVFMIANNISEKPIEIKRGQKVCQMMILKIPQMQIEYGKVDENTIRGANGFGSTGI